MKKVVSMNRKGFTLIEVIVVAAIIAILAGILVPMIFNQIDESKKTKATGEVKTLQQALAAVRTNTLRWPTWSMDNGPCAEDVDFYYNATGVPGAGNKIVLPAGAGPVMKSVLAQPKGSPFALACYMKIDNPTVPTWGGPYLADDAGIDPWGNSYIISVTNLKSSIVAPAPRWGWVISAGPDGVIDTDLTSATVLVPAKDDIGVRIQD